MNQRRRQTIPQSLLRCETIQSISVLRSIDAGIMWNLSFFLFISVTLHFRRVPAFEDMSQSESVNPEKRSFIFSDEDNDDDDEDDPAMCRFSKGYVPNRSNCNQFYICGSEKLGPMLGMCPPGLWFDPEHTEIDDIVCIYPEVACTNHQIDMFKYCKCSELYPMGILAANANSNDALMESSPQCIVDNEFHVYASAVDCERYFICYNGNVKRLQCKPGLHFNAAHAYCDHPNTANCKVIDRQCPPTGISFIRHPTRCDAFYYCRNGEKLIQHCGFHETWDEATLTCVRRNRFDANC